MHAAGNRGADAGAEPRRIDVADVAEEIMAEGRRCGAGRVDAEERDELIAYTLPKRTHQHRCRRKVVFDLELHMVRPLRFERTPGQERGEGPLWRQPAGGVHAGHAFSRAGGTRLVYSPATIQDAMSPCVSAARAVQSACSPTGAPNARYAVLWEKLSAVNSCWGVSKDPVVSKLT